jgi:hypothetical protein
MLEKFTNNPWAQTAGTTSVALDYRRPPQAWDSTAGSHLDAPAFLPRGSCSATEYQNTRITAPGLAARN